MSTVEIRVRPVTRYVVTRFESDNYPNRGGGSASSSSLGEFDNTANADRVAMAIKRTEPNARVVTSDGEVHDSARTHYAIIGAKLDDVFTPVMYAYDEADIQRACHWFKENHPNMSYHIYAQSDVALPANLQPMDVWPLPLQAQQAL